MFAYCCQNTFHDQCMQQSKWSKRVHTVSCHCINIYFLFFSLLCFLFCSPPDETDGPPGAIAMASMLLSLGKKVTIITDRRAVTLNRDIINECVKSGKKCTLYIFSYLCMCRFYLRSWCCKVWWNHAHHCIFYYQFHARYQTRFAAVNICKSHAIPQSSWMLFFLSFANVTELCCSQKKRKSCLGETVLMMPKGIEIISRWRKSFSGCAGSLFFGKEGGGFRIKSTEYRCSRVSEKNIHQLYRDTCTLYSTFNYCIWHDALH